MQNSYRILRLAVAVLLMTTGAQRALGQAVIMNGNYYLTHNEAGTSVNAAATTSFDPTTCLWVYASRDYIRTAGSNGNAITTTTNNYLQYTSLSLGSDWGNWYRGNNNENVFHRTGIFGTYYYLRLNGTTWQINSTNSNNGTLYNVTITSQGPTDNTVASISISGYNNNTITFTGNLSGDFVPQYTRYAFKNANHNWYNNNDYGNTEPSLDASTLSPTYTWSLTADGGGVATINSSTGVLTLSGAPTGNITVRLMVSGISPLSNKTVDFTLTRGYVSAGSHDETVLSNPTISPSSAALYYNEGSQTFTTSATASQTRFTTPAHTTLTGGGNTYLYYNGVLYTNTEAFTTSEVLSTPIVTFSWSLSGDAASYLTRSSAGGTSTTVTHSAQSPTDYTATLTVTASVTDVFKTATATILAYGPMVAPTFKRTGNSVSLSTTTNDATIYYTTDGSTPSASNGTEYTGPINLESLGLPKTIKAIAIRNGRSSTVSQQTYSALSIEPPVITISPTGVVTITCATAGASIRYTTNGTDPTSSSGTVYSGTFSVGNMTTVKAIAYKTGYDDSEVVSELYVTSGVSGGKVVLDDREDHKWTYYNGVDASVDGGNYNTDYAGKLYSPNPRNVKITYDGNGGAVSIDESETVFVYYKTLEQGSTAGQYPYTVISNPFSKRPNGKGFGGWKIISGGDYIQGHSNNDVLSLDEAITFVNLPYPSVNCTSAEIEFQATWVNYNNKTNASGNTITYSVTGGTYETNFLILNRNVTGTITVSSPCTIMMVEPDGSTDYRNTYTFTGNITPNNNGVTKIEFTRWNSTNTLNCNNHSVTVGRGMTTTSQCASYVTGVTGRTQNSGLTTYNTNLDYHLKIESGTFTDVSFIAGTESTAGYVNCNGTANQVKGTLGNDYDRAKSDNTKLTVSDELFLGYRPTYANGNQNNANFTCWVKSGNLCSGTTVTNTTFDGSGAPNGGYYGDAGQVFYVSSAGSQTNIGKRKLYVEGGILSGIAGGIDSNNPADEESFFLRMTGGQVRGVIYGSGAFAASSGIRRFIITGGTINGWVAAGCNGTSPTQSGGTLPSDTYVYVGGTSHVGNTTDLTLNTSSDGNVFGAGSGNSAQATTGQVNNSNVVIADECYIKRNAFGGGNYGYSNATATVYVTGGEVAGSVFGGSNQKQGVTVNVNMTGGQVDQGVYGGSNVTGTISGSVTMNINGGQVGTSSATANIHGGGYGSATRVSQNVELTLGTTDQETPGVTVYGDVYGGSALGYVNGTAATNTYHTNVTMNKGIIHGSLYGGGLGAAGTAANVYGPVAVTVNGGSIRKTDANGANGSGGVYGANNINGAPQRSVTVDIYGTDPAPAENEYALFAVYGGGNQANYTYGNGYPQVTVHNCNNSIEYVYGGGNAAAVASTDVKIYGGNEIGTVFAGGNGTVTAANVTGNTSVQIFGGTIGRVFGGSNSQGTIGGAINVEVNKSGTCAMHIDEVYGGGNMAASKAGNISIGCTGGEGEGIGDVYGGANQANITGNIALNITGGSIQRVFGGNNTSGTISGTIAVNVNWDTVSPCGYNYLGSVFGAGNLATYTGNPAINILNGTVSGNVYGGGKGELVDGVDRGTAGKVTGNPTVTIGDNVSGHTAIVTGEVYGGGDAADVAGTPVIVVNDCNTQIGYLYGGGNAADVNGTNITVNGGTIGTAFGGGHGDKDASSPAKYADVKGNVVFNVYGGTFDRVFAGSNSKGDITGTSTLTINKTGTCAMKIREVYGGGNEAEGNAGAVNIGCTGDLVDGEEGHLAHPENIGTTLEGIGTVYGGANQANIGKDGSPSNITLNINNGMVGNVFGGNNTSGTIYGTITVNVNKTSDACGWYVGNVFGGGNLAAYTGSPAVNIQNGTVSLNVYGGGKGASAVVTGNPVVTIGDATAAHCAIVEGDVYGGGDAAAVTGNTTVTYDDNNASSVVAKLFGGGNAAGVSGTTTVTMTNGKITAGIYGGCNSSGEVTGNITVNINGGTLGVSGTPLTSGIFGGGFGSSTTTAGNVTVNVGDPAAASAGATPTIYGDIYGGSALGTVNDAVADLTTVNFNNGTIHGNIYGGGLGAATLDEHGYVASVTTAAIVNGTVHVNIGTDSQASNYVTIDGQVFGCNNYAGSPKGHVYVDVYRTAHTGANAYPDPEPAGPMDVTEQAATAFAIAAVYGGGNLADYTTTTTGASTHVHIHNCNNTIQYVYGGGNAASSPATDVVIDGGRFNYIFGGGNGAGTGNPGADIEGNAVVTLNGGLVYRAFGGSNTKGNIGGTSSVDLPQSTTCTRLVHEIFGGGNEAPGGSVDMVIPCGTTGTGLVYGGANNADMGTEEDFNNGHPVLVKLTVEGGNFSQVFGGNNQGGTIWGDVELWLKGGTIDQAFGGNNLGGNVKGSIKVYVVDAESTDCPLVLTDVYGGGYNAAYTPADPTQSSPQVFIYHKKSGTAIAGNVFGGGLGATATVTANPVVTIGDDDPDHYVTINGDVYGGGDAGNVIGTTQVNVYNKCNTTIGNVYGGGNAADVNGTDVNIDGGTITGMVFGGGHGDKESLGTGHTDKVADVNGNTSVTITGGNINKVFAGSNINGTITGTSNELIINKSATAACDMKIREVYGGGNLAAGNATTISVGCTGTWTVDDDDSDDNNNFHNKHNTTDNRIGYELEGIGTVYGGANQADVGTELAPSNITLNINSGMVENVFGGNNTSGTIYGSIEVNIEKTSDACGWYVGNVFGGGNLAAYTGSPEVNIKNGTVSQNVYGGGKGSTAVVTGNPVVLVGDATAAYCAIVSGDVYGGGDAAAVTGNTSVTYNDANVSSTVGKLFGGGNAAGVSGTATVTLTTGQVTAGVYGGCNASGSVGDVTIALNGGAVGTSTPGSEADVYGGGLGASTTTAGNIGVTLNGTIVYGDLYGGSALGSVNASTSNTTTLNIITNTLHGSIYGGGKGDHTSLGGGHSNVTAISNGNVIINYNTAITDLAGLYGGANINGLVSGNIALNVMANVGAAEVGTVGDPGYVAEKRIDIFGGGYGANTNTGGDVTVTIGNIGGTIVPTIYGDLYGGSALGNVNDAAADVTTIDFLNGTLHGNIYGGGLGDGSNAAKVNGKVMVNISNSAQEAANCHIDLRGVTIYGCNNTNGSPQDDVEVHIYKTAHTTTDVAAYAEDDGVHGAPTYAIDQVFGGGNQADYAPEDALASSTKKAKVYIHGCENTIRRVFGGGNAAAATGVFTEIDGGRFANVFGGGNGEVTAANIGHGGTDLHVHGGKITQLFGGSNTSGTITGNMGISVDATGTCASDMYVDEFFCGNNLANIGTPENPVNINATIGCGTKFGDIYGGCNLADIYGNVTLTIVGGEMNYVYGGSKGRSATSDPGNPEPKAANITGNTTLNIYGGNIKQDAFGGSNINGNITGNITVNMDWSQASTDCNSPADLYVGNIYGGSNLAAYTPTTPGASPAVNINHGTVTHSVFGGGKGATAVVTSNPVVTIGDNVAGHTAKITDNVYGGGDLAKVEGSTSVNIAGGALVAGDIYGGGSLADVAQNVNVSMTGGRVLNDIYGGGALANTNTDNWNAADPKVGYYGTNIPVGTSLDGLGLYYKEVNYVAPSETKAQPGVTYYRYEGGVYSPVAEDNITVYVTDVTSYYVRTYGGFAPASGTAQADVPYYETATGDWAAGKNDPSTGTTYKTTVSLTGGIIGHLADGTANDYRGGNVYGGGLGRLAGTGGPAVRAMVYGDVDVTVNGTAFIQRLVSPGVGIADVPFSGRVFGCNNLNGTPKGDVKVTVRKTIPVDASGNIVALHDENKFDMHSVYGGGNLAGYEPADGKSLLVVIDGCEETSIEKVFGGGNSAPVPSTQVVVLGSYNVGYAFGGGNGADRVWKNNSWNDNDGAPIYGNTLVLGVGGKIGQVFSGSDTKGTVFGNATVKLKGTDDMGGWTSECPLKVTNTYGAGRGADVMGDVNLFVSACGGAGDAVERVFGGSFDANIRGNINLTITSGIYTQVFGGNDHGGSIGGNITVNIEETDNCNPIVIQYLYGGGREAAYPGAGAKTESGTDFTSGHITVNVKSATRIDNVFGGSYRALVVGNTDVNISMIKGGWATHDIRFPESYRGDQIPNVTNPHVEYDVASVTYPDSGEGIVGSLVNGLYTRSGAGEPYTYTKIEDVDARAEVGTTYYRLMMTGTVKDDIGTIGNVFGGSFESEVQGNATVNIGTLTEIDIMKRDGAGNILATDGEPLYSGGDIRPSAVVDYVKRTVEGANITGNVYGGGNNGMVTGNTQVNICAKESATPGEYVTVAPGTSGVTINGSDYPYGVFGGGNNGKVTGNSAVYMGAGDVNESVYGGGCRADVEGNARVEMIDGYVFDGIYGGGLHGSVGTYTRTTSITTESNGVNHASHAECVGMPTARTAGGLCTVIVKGGRVGPAEAAMANGGMKNTGNLAGYDGGPVDVGFVFGAGRGEALDPAVDIDADFHCYVNNTDVTITGTALIMASVYGGGENGRVLGNTHVTISGGQIGCGEGKIDGSGNPIPYAPSDFIDPTTATAAEIDAKAATMTECAHWDYTLPYLPYDPLAGPGDTDASTVATDGKSYYGSVFGGGSGYFPYEKSDGTHDWLRSAGKVHGNTVVDITAGHILTNIYGGNELTDVLGSCTVNFGGTATLGVPRTLDAIASTPVTCYLFGAGKGDQRQHFNDWTNVGSVIVNVTGGIIYGSVFGGAEDGHVLGNCTTNISSGAKIGTWGTSYVDGNVFGGGRGFSGEALTAGAVCGNILVNITGGKMLGSIYGGGRLASVGSYLVATNDANYGHLQDGDDHGHITVNIDGGVIGNPYEFIMPNADDNVAAGITGTGKDNLDNWTAEDWATWKAYKHIPNTEFGTSGSDKNRLMRTKGGNVFAGGMGRLFKLNGDVIPHWDKLGEAKSTTLNITDGTIIKGDVYGGGEFGCLDGYHTVDGGHYSAEINVTGGTIGSEISDASGVRYTFGSIYGGGFGSDDASVGSETIPYARERAGYVSDSIMININESGGSTHVWTSVYGGGEMAITGGSTRISMSAGQIGKNEVYGRDSLNPGYVKYGGYRMGNIFGGGKGLTDYVNAGLVKGNTTITVTGGSIYHNVYGGGAWGSVGTFTLDGTGMPDITSWAAGTGEARVNILGGTIGISGRDNGMVNGSSRGDVETPSGSPAVDPNDKLGWVKDAFVTIGDGTTTPLVKGSVYGGGENGHNAGNATVTVKSGLIGVFPGDTWETFSDTPATEATIQAKAKRTRGNVYGAGCGTDTYWVDANSNGVEDDGEDHHNPWAGDVRGNTSVTIAGGQVTTNVYGGGSMGSVEGNSAVNVTGGRIGIDGDGNGSVYGGPRGDSHDGETIAHVIGTSTVNINYSTYPTADNLAHTENLIAGSVYGGGEMGIVRGNIEVEMDGGLVLHNVYGGGDMATVYGNTFVNLLDGIITEDAYGGARGTETVAPEVRGNVLVLLNNKNNGADVLTTDHGCRVRRVFGCNDRNGTPRGNVVVRVYGTQHKNKTTFGDKYAKFTDEVSTEEECATLASAVGISLAGYSTLEEKREAVAKAKYDVEAVYGGGNLASYEPYGPLGNGTAEDNKNTEAFAEVDIFGCGVTSIRQLYGGGNAAPVPATSVFVMEAYEIDQMFGGGNGKDVVLKDGVYYGNPGANVGYHTFNHYVTSGETGYNAGEHGTGASEANAYKAILNSDATNKDLRTLHYSYGTGVANSDIIGGRIHVAYGGSNIRGNVRQTIMTKYEKNPACELIIDKSYGGGNEADTDAEINVEMACIDYRHQIFGGSTEGDVNSDIHLRVTNGTFDEVYGGNDRTGLVKGAITIDIIESGCRPIVIDNLYLGGYQAGYSIYGYNSDESPRTKEQYEAAVTTALTGHESDTEEQKQEVLIAAGLYGYPKDNPRLNIISATRINNVYGGGNDAVVIGNPYVNVNMERGKVMASYVDDSFTAADGKFTSGVHEIADDHGLSYTYNIEDYEPVTGSAHGNALLSIGTIGNIFGGGNMHNIIGNTHIDIGTGIQHDAHGDEEIITPARNAAFITGRVYGGGNLGDVSGNTMIEMANGYVYDRIYGGGKEGHVGTATTWAALPTGHPSHSGCLGKGKPTAFATNTGKTTVVMSGGYLGPFTYSAGVATISPMTMPQDYGYIFAAGRGELANPTVDPDIDFRTYVDTAEVTVKNGYVAGHDGDGDYITRPLIAGAVYGGSENGRVLHDTYVNIQGGQIGIGKNLTTAYAEADFIDPILPVNATAADIEEKATAIEAKAAVMPECASWDYTSPWRVYDEHATANAAYGNASTTGTDGRTFYGNVFGGGSGYFTYQVGDTYEWLRSAGLVEGDTHVNITGGHILTTVYGGNEMTDVTGTCHITMTGGTVGLPRTRALMSNHPVTCFIFGAGKGDPRHHFNKWTNVGNVDLNVSGGTIYGSVLGGGEDGHVLGDVTVNISDGAKIGTWGTSYVDGNVFGAGRGFEPNTYTAGSVCGTTTVNITGGRLQGSVYGGGRQGSVGYGLFDPGETGYGEMMADNATEAGTPPPGGTFPHGRGHVTVNISGDNTVIGNPYEFVFPAAENIPTGLDADFHNWSDADWVTWQAHNRVPKATYDHSNGRLKHSRGGNVYTGGMGRREQLDNVTEVTAIDWTKLGNVKSTTLNITGNPWIMSNIYGGCEVGSVKPYIDNSSSTPVVQGGTTTLNIQGGTIGTEITSGAPVKATIPTTATRSDVKYTFGNVYGGGMGKEEHGLTDHHGGDVKGNTTVTISGATTKVRASVFGGGEMGVVEGNAVVNISDGEIGRNEVKPADDSDAGYVLFGSSYMGNVYGAGQGALEHAFAGQVKGNTTINVTGGSIYHMVYGGGALGSVGDFKLSDGAGHPTYIPYAGIPYGWDTLSDGETPNGKSTGLATINITGGTIGISGRDNGLVFGSSRGNLKNLYVHYTQDEIDAAHEGDDAYGKTTADYKKLQNDPYDNVAWVKSSVVNIGTPGSSDLTTPLIKGSVYGGGENGHNEESATVNVYSGTIGICDEADPWYSFTDKDLETRVRTYRGNVYGAGSGADTYTNPIDHKSYYNPKSGMVAGNTYVNIAGGHVGRNVYGGGAMSMVGTLTNEADTIQGGPDKHMNIETVGGMEVVKGFGLSWPYRISFAPGTGKATVNITGGHIGTKDLDGGDVYGSSRGVAGDRYAMAHLAYVNETEVNVNYPSTYAAPDEATIQNTFTIPCITGSVHGSGENGYVYGDTHVTLNKGLIGHSLYGAGKGKGTYTLPLNKVGGGGTYNAEIYSLIAGRVMGNTYVTMNDGHVMRNVYGGGNMGSVGKGNYAGGLDDYVHDCAYGELMGYGELAWSGSAQTNLWDNVSDDSKAFLSSGKTTVNVVGGTVGYIDATNPEVSMKNELPYGNVFGGSAGESAANVMENPRYHYVPAFYSGYVNETDVTIGGYRCTTAYTDAGSTAHAVGEVVSAATYQTSYTSDASNWTLVGPTILASVYGGGQDGHVRRDTHVKVLSGEIGKAYTAANQSLLQTSDLDSPQWLYRGNVFGAGSGITKYHFDFNGDGDTDDNAGDGSITYNGQSVKEEDYSMASGSVTRFTTVDILGGTIHRNVYGGGSLGSVGPPNMGQLLQPFSPNDSSHSSDIGRQSMCTVNIGGAGKVTIGTPTGFNPVYGGEVYGASRGIAELQPQEDDFSYVIWTQVNVKDGAVILNNVFGGGDAGKVKRNTEVNIGDPAAP